MRQGARAGKGTAVTTRDDAKHGRPATPPKAAERRPVRGLGRVIVNSPSDEDGVEQVEHSDATPGVPGEGLGRVAREWLKPQLGDDPCDKVVMRTKRKGLVGCGRAGGSEVFAAERMVEGRVQKTLKGTLVCGQTWVCNRCSLAAAMRLSDKMVTRTAAYLKASPSNALVMLTLTTPRSIADDPDEWRASSRLAREAFDEFSRHYLARAVELPPTRAIFRACERMYGLPTRWLRGERVGWGVHAHHHLLIYTTSEWFLTGELEMSERIFAAWRRAVLYVVERNPAAYPWVDRENPVKAPFYENGIVKGAVSVKHIDTEGDEAQVRKVVAYILKEMTGQGGKKEGRGEADSHSWQGLLAIGRDADDGASLRVAWARRMFRFHVEDSFGTRAFSFNVRKTFGGKTGMVPDDSAGEKESGMVPVLGASASAKAWTKARSMPGFDKDLEYVQRHGGDWTGVSGFARDARTQQEKFEVLRLQKEKRLDGLARRLGLAKTPPSRSAFVVERLAAQGYVWDEALGRYTTSMELQKKRAEQGKNDEVTAPPRSQPKG